MRPATPEAATAALEYAFSAIHRDQMAGLPLLNERLRVEAVAFRHHGERILGVLVTPWMMSLVLLPGQEEGWSNLEIGRKLRHPFPARTLKFTVNGIEGIGNLQTYSIHSPMHGFTDQGQARTVAKRFLATLLEPSTEELKDEPNRELLGRVLRGEEVEPPPRETLRPRRLTRRGLLRGDWNSGI